MMAADFQLMYVYINAIKCCYGFKLQHVLALVPVVHGLLSTAMSSCWTSNPSNSTISERYKVLMHHALRIKELRVPLGM